jgi:hypothetical protein
MASLEPDRLEASARVIANFAWQHLKAATLFREHVMEIEAKNFGEPLGVFFEDIRSYCSACIMSCAAALEALINELFIAPNLRLRPMLGNFEEEFWGRNGIENKSILEKYKLALTLLGANSFDESTTPYRDAWALIELRNALVHYKPTWDPDRKRKIDLVEVLRGRYQESPFIIGNADFVSMESMSAGCARWAVSTTLALMKEFHARTNLDDDKMSNFWKLS